MGRAVMLGLRRVGILNGNEMRRGYAVITAAQRPISFPFSIPTRLNPSITARSETK